MTTPSENQDSLSDAASVGAGRRPFWTWLGWGWLALLVGSTLFLTYRLMPRDALDLGEDSVGYALLCVALFGVVVVTVFVWAIMGLWRFWKRRPGYWTPCVRLVVLIIALVAVITHRKPPPFNPITPESEPQYLAIAMLAHAKLSEIPSSVLGFDHEVGDTESVEAIRKQFDKLIPAYWPRHLLYVVIDGDCVVLARGSGMLGTVGVRIYDRGRTAPLYSPADLKKNTYLPRERRITDRLWYFTSE